MTFEALVTNFAQHLETLPRPVDREFLLRSLQQWLSKHLGEWRPELRSQYGLDKYAAMELPSFPIADATLSAEEEYRQLRAVPPVSMETFAMRLRNVFWEGITVESTITCPRCGDSSLRILEDPSSNGIVLACDLCGWAQSPIGEHWSGDRNLQPPTSSRLDQWRGEQRAPSGAH